MAIYSLHHSSIGRSKQSAGTAGAHLQYILRDQDHTNVVAHEIPKTAPNARTYFNRIEGRIRKNGRVLDKIMVALPRELSPEQRMALVREYCTDVTGNRCGWLAALHNNHADASNPHAHIVFRDEDLKTGKRFLFVSDSPRDREAKGLPAKFTEWLRERWEHFTNWFLRKNQHEARIDRRSLKDQGIDRIPQIHIGPNAQHILRNVDVPRSGVANQNRWGKDRRIDYPLIDAGRTRADRNNEIIDFNLEKQRRSDDPAVRAWAEFEIDQLGKDRALHHKHALENRRTTLKERRIRAHHRERLADIKARQTNEMQASRQLVREKFKPYVAKLNRLYDDALDALGEKESTLFGKAVSAMDFTGTVRRRRRERREALDQKYADQKKRIMAKAKSLDIRLRNAVRARYSEEIDTWRMERRTALNRFRAASYDREGLQKREWITRMTERATAKAEITAQIRAWRGDLRTDWDRYNDLDRR